VKSIVGKPFLYSVSLRKYYNLNYKPMLILSNILSSILLWVPSGGELVLIGLLILIFFGAKRIPELARGLGKGIREFKDATKEVRDEIDENVKETKKSIKD